MVKRSTSCHPASQPSPPIFSLSSAGSFQYGSKWVHRLKSNNDMVQRVRCEKDWLCSKSVSVRQSKLGSSCFAVVEPRRPLFGELSVCWQVVSAGFSLVTPLDRSLDRARVPGFVFNRNNIQEKTTFIKKSIHPNQMSTLVLLRLVSSVKFVGEHSSQLPFQKWWIYGNWEFWAPLVFTTMTKHQTVDEHHAPYHHFTFQDMHLKNVERVIWPGEPCSY